MVRHSPLRWLAGLLALTAVVGIYAFHALCAQDRATPRSPESELYRLSRNMAGEARPVIFHADEIATWTERDPAGDRQAVLLRGTVQVQQNALHARFQQGAAWVDLRQYRETGLLHVQIYAEGAVQVDSGEEVRAAPRAVLDLTTRGELRLYGHKSRVQQQPRAADPLMQRAREQVLGPPANHPGSPSPDLPPPTAEGPRVYRAFYQTAPPGEALADTPGVPGQGSPTSPEIAPIPVPLPGGNGPAAGPGPLSPSSPLGQPPGAVPAPPGAPAPAPGPPGIPTPLPPPSQATPPPPGAAVAPAPQRSFTVAPRRGQSFNILQNPVGPNGEQSVIITGGVILTVRNAPSIGLLDLEADRVVIWYKGGEGQRTFGNMQSSEGESTNQIEFYLSGNVELRNQSPNVARGETRTLRADELYYDVDRNVAVAIKARLEMRQPKVPDPVILTAAELFQINVNTFEVHQSEVFSSKLPSDPGLKVYMANATVVDQTVPMVSIFGRPVLDRKTGQPLETKQSIVTGHDVFAELESFPFFYTPYLKADARNPLGPLQEINAGYSRIYGPTFSFTFDVYQLLGIQKPPQTAWRFNLDYLGYRGPAAGTTYDTFVREFFSIPAENTIGVRGYAIDDRNFDILGGPRPMNDFNPTAFRGWLQVRENVQEMPNGFTLQNQFVGISDRNFVEAYFKRIWDTDVNQATFTYLKQQQDNWAWSALLEPRLRAWITETMWLPRLDGYLIGQSLLDNLLTYNVHANAAFASLQVTNGTQNTISPTDRYDTTGRFDIMQELSAPLKLGPFKVVPYGMLDLTQYTHDLDGNCVGRVWGAGGVRGSLPLTRVYSEIQSDLWNLNGINHKIVAGANYFYSWTNEPYTLFPQLDRLNDDASDQALRDIYPLQPYFLPGSFPNPLTTGPGAFLISSNLFQPQNYAIQRLLLSRVDTLATIEELQLDLRQRWQTKRGYPGFQHITDWMVLDLSATFFPRPGRDDFGQPWSYLEYDWLWNIGDRTALTSSAWVDPINNGPHVYTIGGFFNRPDRTNFYIGYRQIDPLQSKAVTASATYVFSPKYAGTASATYDFGIGISMSNTLMFTRIGSDLTVSLGVTYNALQNNFGFLFQIVPNLVPGGRAPTLGSGLYR